MISAVLKRLICKQACVLPVFTTYHPHLNSVGPQIEDSFKEVVTEIVGRMQLMPETLHLAVDLIDRFLERKPVTRKNLQLVGISIIFCQSLKAGRRG
jgi:Cyclin, N-terminal domain